MAPIWIRNRAYSSRTIGLTDRKVLLMNRPWDYFTQRIMVPCGRCEECLRQQRNDWYVRLERETKYQKSLYRNSVFVTITIAPEYYDSALQNPSSFIRMWFERVRRRFGHSIKHAVFQEFGVHPELGNEPRLHFHGVLWDVPYAYNAIREAVKDLGFVWIASITDKRLRYVVKYVGKSVYMDERSADFAKSLSITVGKLNTNLYDFLQNSKYRRKFISAGVGDYLGDFKAPGVASGLWSYTDFKTGTVYRYLSLATTISIFLKMRYFFVRFLLLGPMLVLSVVLWLLAFFVKLLRGSFVPPTFPVSLKEVFRAL